MFKLLMYGDFKEFTIAAKCVPFKVDTYKTVYQTNAVVTSLLEKQVDLVVVNRVTDLEVIRELNKSVLVCLIADTISTATITKYPFTAIIQSDDANAAVNVLLTAKEISRASVLDNSRVQKDNCPVYIQTFGKFEVYLYGKCAYFKSKKAKEMLAYYVHSNGDYINSDEMISILWPDRPNDINTQNLHSKMRFSLKKVLDELGVDSHFYIIDRLAARVDPNYFRCDLYEALNGDLSAINMFRGEYMSQYSWAEEKLSWLETNLL